MQNGLRVWSGPRSCDTQTNGLSVCSGHCNKNTINWVAETTSLFLTVVEAQSPRSRCWQIRGLVRVLFLVHTQLTSHCSLTQQMELGSSLGVFYKGTNPIVKILPL